MIDIKLIREEKELVKENIKKKFQDEKLPLVDEIYELDMKYRNTKKEADDLRNKKNKLSDQIGIMMREGKLEEAKKIKEEVGAISFKIANLEAEEEKLENTIKEKMMMIPQMIDDSVPIGKDDSENVELERFGEPLVPEYEIPYHADICESLNGLDKEAAGEQAEMVFIF